jgi:hypothetical protein
MILRGIPRKHIPQHGVPLLVPVDLPIKIQPQHGPQVCQRNARPRLLIQLLGSLRKIQPQRIQLRGLLLGIQVAQHLEILLHHILRIGTLVHRPLQLIIQLGQPVAILVLLLEETQLRHTIQISQRNTRPQLLILRHGTLLEIPRQLIPLLTLRHGIQVKVHLEILQPHIQHTGIQVGQLQLRIQLLGQPVAVLVDLLIKTQLRHIIRVSQRNTRPQLLILRHGTLLEIPRQLILPRIILAGTLLGQQNNRPQPHTTQVGQRNTLPRLLIQLLGSLSKIQPQRIQLRGLLLGTQVSQLNTRLPHRTLRLGRQLETLQPRGQLHIRPHSIRHSQQNTRP